MHELDPVPLYNIIINMKTISVSVSESVYEDFRLAARKMDRSIAQLIREAMRTYRDLYLTEREPLRELPVLSSMKPLGDLPSREEIWSEISASRLDKE
jgi:hypothetical protein